MKTVYSVSRKLVLGQGLNAPNAPHALLHFLSLESDVFCRQKMACTIIVSCINRAIAVIVLFSSGKGSVHGLIILHF